MIPINEPNVQQRYINVYTALVKPRALKVCVFMRP